MHRIANILLMLVSIVGVAFAQQARIDSLRTELKPYSAGKKHDKRYVSILLRLSSLLEKTEPTTGIAYTEKAVKAARELKLYDVESRGYNQLGIQKRDVGNWDEALKLFRTAQEIADKNDICVEHGNAVNNIAVIYQRQGKLNECLEMHKEAQQIRMKCNDQAGLIGTYVNMGIVNRKQGFLDVAMKYYLLALEMLEKVDDKSTLPNVYNNIGNVEIEQGKFSEAIQWYKKAEAIYSAQGVGERLARTLGNLADAYRFSGDTLLSNVALRKAADWYFSSPTPPSQIYGNKNMGMLHENLRNPDSAIHYYTRSYKVGERLSDLETMINALQSMTIVAIKYGMADKALVYTDSILALTKRTSARLYTSNALQLRAEALYTLGRYPEAYTVYLDYLNEKDSVFTRERTQRIAELEVQYKVQLAERENNLLKKQKQLDDADLANKTSLLELVEKERRLQELELLNRSRAMELQRENALRDRQRIQLLEKDRSIHSIDLEKEQWRSSLWLTGVLGMGFITFLLVFVHRTRKRSLIQQREKNLELQRASIEIISQQKELRAQNQRLASLNMEKNEILAVAAHDLKNPIGSVLGLAQLIVNSNTQDAARKECIVQIEHSSRKMLRLVTNLLDIDKIETGKKESNSVPVNLSYILEEAVVHNEWQAREKQIRLVLNAGTLPANMIADVYTLTQIIDNLISNAIKFSYRGSSVTIEAFQAGGRAQINVSDQGPGLSEEDKVHLFGKFSRLSPRPTGGENSTGLGLYIVKRLVTELHGSIRCESEPGKGSTFIVELPIAGNRNNGLI